MASSRFHRRLGAIMALVALVGSGLGLALWVDRMMTLSASYRAQSAFHADQQAFWLGRQRRGMMFVAYLRTVAEDSRRSAEAGEPGLSPYLWRRRAELMDAAAEETAAFYEPHRRAMEHHRARAAVYAWAARRPWMPLPPLPAAPPLPGVP